MRVGKFVEHFKLASELYDATATVRFNAGDQILQYLAVLRQLGYAFYLTFDTLTVLDALGARKSATAKRLQMQAYKAWLIGLVASALAGILSTYRFMRQAEIMAADEKVSKEDIQSLKKYAYLLMMRPELTNCQKTRGDKFTAHFGSMRSDHSIVRAWLC